jgi:nitronate monooxygenase
MRRSVSIETQLCRDLGIRVPIIQAPVGGGTCPRLAAAVSNAGALGMLALSWLDVDDFRDEIRQTAALTDGPFEVNLVLAWDQRERMSIALAEGVRVLSLFWAQPEDARWYLEAAHEAGAFIMSTVGSAGEARRTRDMGFDAVLAQGFEAGGHGWGSVGTMSLIPAAVDAAAPVPVIAAGGIADGRGVAAALVLGAQAAWLGTRFVASEESLFHSSYKRRLVEADQTETAWSKLFDIGWPPESPVRTLRNSTYTRWQEAGMMLPGHRPGEGETVAMYTDGQDVIRHRSTPPQVGMTGDMEAMANYAGQGVELVTAILPAGEIVSQVATEAEAALAALVDSPG